MDLFLTSDIGGIKKKDNKKVAISFTNNNNFLNNLKKSIKNYNKFVLIASNPDDFEKNDKYLELDIEALELSGLTFKDYVVLDYRTVTDIKNILTNASLIFLCGGNTYEQNLFFNNINLSKYIKSLDCCVVGISAGSINSPSVVFDSYSDVCDFNRPYILNGLGITNINIEPHFDKNISNEVKIMNILNESYNRKIYGLVDGSYILNHIIYGKCYEIYKGKIELICSDNQTININE